MSLELTILTVTEVVDAGAGLGLAVNDDGADLMQKMLLRWLTSVMQIQLMQSLKRLAFLSWKLKAGMRLWDLRETWMLLISSWPEESNLRKEFFGAVPWAFSFEWDHICNLHVD